MNNTFDSIDGHIETDIGVCKGPTHSIIITTDSIIAVGQFELISEKEFKKCVNDACIFNEDYDAICNSYYREKDSFLPTRSTAGSAGYDFKAFRDYTILPKSEILIHTFVKCKIKPGWMLAMFPRSGLGFKYGVRLSNTVGIIDSDYYGCEGNEGHIMCKLVNPSDKRIEIHRGDKYCQGIFIPYGITLNDSQDQKSTRSGGFGSTDSSSSN